MRTTTEVRPQHEAVFQLHISVQFSRRVRGLLRLGDIESKAEGIDLKEVEVSLDMLALAIILN